MSQEFFQEIQIFQRLLEKIGIDKDRCYSNYQEMAYRSSRYDGIEVVAIMTPPSSHQIIAEKFIDKNIHNI